ncbi:unnamed protein product [Linum tenue]|uniref:Uncharacterized protein n=1 Tax=Linum tenue TaxID=586396 RepID=A0AAV0K217_9ROSI|nr:unnamed protein product [Linum tenue]
MECSICCTMPLILRPPRNTICAGCYEAARTAISLVNKFESSCDRGSSLSSPSSSDHHSTHKAQPLANLPKWINSLNETHNELTQKIDFLGNIVQLFRSQLLTDIHLKPGNGGAPIPAHRALLVNSVCCRSSSGDLKETAVKYVVKNMEELAFSGKYEAFVASNPHLAVQVTRAFLVDAKLAR